MFINRVRELAFLERRYATDTLVELKDKAVRMPGTCHQVLALFSRSGFTESLQAEAASQGVFLFGLEDVL